MRPNFIAGWQDGRMAGWIAERIAQRIAGIPNPAILQFCHPAISV
jgi:hypothetical protein